MPFQADLLDLVSSLIAPQLPKSKTIFGMFLITNLEPSRTCWMWMRIGCSETGRDEGLDIPVTLRDAPSQVGCRKQTSQHVSPRTQPQRQPRLAAKGR